LPVFSQKGKGVTQHSVSQLAPNCKTDETPNYILSEQLWSMSAREGFVPPKPPPLDALPLLMLPMRSWRRLVAHLGTQRLILTCP